VAKMPRIGCQLLRSILILVSEKRPVPIVVTYLRGDAQSWWTQFGKE